MHPRWRTFFFISVLLSVGVFHCVSGMQLVLHFLHGERVALRRRFRKPLVGLDLVLLYPNAGFVARTDDELGIHIAFIRAFQEIVEYSGLHVFRIGGMRWRNSHQ